MCIEYLKHGDCCAYCIYLVMARSSSQVLPRWIMCGGLLVALGMTTSQ